LPISEQLGEEQKSVSDPDVDLTIKNTTNTLNTDVAPDPDDGPPFKEMEFDDPPDGPPFKEFKFDDPPDGAPYADHKFGYTVIKSNPFKEPKDGSPIKDPGDGPPYKQPRDGPADDPGDGPP